MASELPEHLKACHEMKHWNQKLNSEEQFFYPVSLESVYDTDVLLLNDSTQSDTFGGEKYILESYFS